MAKKEFRYRGKTLEELQRLNAKEFSALLQSKLRISINRGFTADEQSLIDKLSKGNEKLRTHSRELIILPMMVGKVISIHNGKKFINLHVQAEMLGHRLGEFVDTRSRVGHNAPGIGATKSSASASVK